MISPKKIYKLQISIRVVPCHRSLGNCKLILKNGTTYLLEWLKPPKLTTSNAGKQRATGALIHCEWMKNGATTLLDSLAASYKAKCNLIMQSMIALLGIHPSELKIHVHKKLYAHQHYSQLPNDECPSIGTWVNKKQYFYTMNYCLAWERKESLSHEKKWRSLKNMLIILRNPSEEATHQIILTI